MTVEFTVTAGTSTSTFDMYSDADGFVTPFETGVLLAYINTPGGIATVPAGTTIVRIQTLVDCDKSIDINLNGASCGIGPLVVTATQI
jgi:hypothetical protein